MRLHIFTNRDLASNIMLNLLVPVFHKNGYSLHIFLSDKVGGNAPSVPEALRQLKFFEQQLPNEILFPGLEKSMRSAGDYFLSFQEISRCYAIPVESLNEVRSAETLARLAHLSPDLVLSIRYGKIFGADFLRIPRQGVVNLHSGILPAYRGVLATFRALQNGDTEIGCTLHYIEDATIDTGSILGFSKQKVVPERSLLWHILSLYPASAQMVTETVHAIARGNKPSGSPQPATGAAYFTFPTQPELEAFVEKGWKIADYADVLEWYRRYL